MSDQTPSFIPAAILFDMDGTLTAPLLDFPRIKAEMGIGARPILEALAEMDAAARETAQAILHRHEEHAAANATLNPGCMELLTWVRGRRIRTALVTRNSAVSVRTVLAAHGLTFDALVTREDGPYKPDPFPLRLACRKLGVEPDAAWMVGDGQYDVEAGRAAAIPTVWVSHGRQRPFDAAPWREVRDLHQVLQLLCGAET